MNSNQKYDFFDSRLKLCRGLRFRSSESCLGGSNSGEHEPNQLSASTNDPQRTITTVVEPQLPEGSPAPTTRYARDFLELGFVGNGEFGSVYRCLNRLDGCVYAVKRSKRLAIGNAYGRRRATNEIHANAALNNHRNLVRYYSAWLEDDQFHIKQEFCNGGDLGRRIEAMRRDGASFEERELRMLLVHVAEGLRWVGVSLLWWWISC